MCPDAQENGMVGAPAPMSEREAAMQSVYVLAFLGDGVYSLLVREMLVKKGGAKAGELHRLCVQQVNAAAQAAAYRRIGGYLREPEQDVYRRARNARSTHTPKNMSEGEYHSATGMEAVFGYLYLSGQKSRLYELFRLIAEEPQESETAAGAR